MTGFHFQKSGSLWFVSIAGTGVSIGTVRAERGRTSKKRWRAETPGGNQITGYNLRREAAEWLARQKDAS